MMSFKPYYDKWIYEWIEDEYLDIEIRKIYRMNLDELKDFSDSLETRAILESGYEHSYECRVIGKTVIKAIDIAVKKGQRLTPKVSLLGCFGAVMEGIFRSDLVDKNRS
jgi:hypothetical protein